MCYNKCITMRGMLRAREDVMRLFHLSDLHLGIKPGGRDISEDMRTILLDGVLGAAYEKYRPDGVIIAGDIYDRRTPPAESVALFDEFIEKAAGLSLSLYMISGNHDSAERVAYGRALFGRCGVHISRPLDGAPPFVSVAEAGGVDIALLPNVTTEAVNAWFPEEEAQDISEALRVVFAKAGIPRAGRPCILAAHQALGNSADAQAVGKLRMASPAVFEPFAYTALGHYHTPLSFGERVRYCGSPMCFSRKEARSPQKYIDVIDIDESGAVSVQHEPITPPHPARVVSGTIAELLGGERTDDYVYITITGGDDVGGYADRLSAVYPNYIDIAYELGGGQETAQTVQGSEREMGFDELFDGFYRMRYGEDPDGELAGLAQELFERSMREEL